MCWLRKQGAGFGKQRQFRKASGCLGRGAGYVNRGPVLESSASFVKQAVVWEGVLVS